MLRFSAKLNQLSRPLASGLGKSNQLLSLWLFSNKLNSKNLMEFSASSNLLDGSLLEEIGSVVAAEVYSW
ncbi:hypothetical protein WN943_022927 [Citrus x changshan-huyou]